MASVVLITSLVIWCLFLVVCTAPRRDLQAVKEHCFFRGGVCSCRSATDCYLKVHAVVPVWKREVTGFNGEHLSQQTN